MSDHAKGFYLSQYQAAIGLPELQAAWDAGYRFVQIRASSGLHADPTFARHWNNAGKLGFLRSAWHYLTQDDDGQAALFQAVVGDRQPEMGLCGDFEAGDLTLAKCDQFLEAADRLFGQTCNVYTRKSWLDPRGKPPWQAEGRRLWVCDVNSPDAPLLPKAFTAWEWWQHGCGHPAPFPCDVCLDRYHGTEAELYANYGPQEDPMIEVLDRYGNRQSWAWLEKNYGDLQVHSFPETESGWRLVRLKENADLVVNRLSKAALKAYVSRMEQAGWPVRRGKITVSQGENKVEVDGILAPSVIIAKFLDINGNPVAGQRVCWYWPDAPLQDGCVPLNGLEPGILPGRYSGPGTTNANGDIGFAMGGGAYYTPPEIGPHAIWPCCPGQYGDSCRGFGMLAGTNHYSVWPTFQWVAGQEPGECPWPEIEAQLVNVEAAIAAIRALR